MPSPSYNIKYRQGDFFYNTIDPTKNVDLLSTFPFTKEKVIMWAKQVGNTNIDSINDIFDPQISGIIMNPEYDFGNTFLPGNIKFNDNFNALSFNLSNPVTFSGTPGEKNVKISGNVIISQSGKPITLDISNSSSELSYTQDSMNNLGPKIDINAFLSEDIPFTDTDGGQSTIIKTTNNPRCKYRKTCTIDHWHYSGGCKTQITQRTSEDGTAMTHCTCICTGAPVFNNEPHSHCDELTINPDGTAKTNDGNNRPIPDSYLLQTIHNIKLNLTAEIYKTETGVSANGNSVSLGYKNADTLKETDKQIRHLIVKYYNEVYNNIQLQTHVQSTSNKDVTMSQSMMDATVQYKTEYLNVFNIVVGIFCVSGYIFIMGKK